VMGMLEARCRILRELGLKAAFHTFERKCQTWT
jgi:hypothetical protein